MTLIFPLILLLVIVAVVAGLHSEGCWSNIVTLFNTLTGALIATNYFEPLAAWVEEQSPAAAYVWDFVMVWALFICSTFVLRMLTDKVSRVKVRFLRPVELIGTYVFALLTAWVLVCFTTFTMHTAPLQREFLWGGFRAENHMMFGLAPDRKWLGFVYNVSRGSLSQSYEGQYAFDPQGTFMIRYASRRQSYEAVPGFTTGGDAGPVAPN